MANIAPSWEYGSGDARVITWTGLTDADTALPAHLSGQTALAGAVQVVGTFGGATLTMQVSNDGTNWATLKDGIGGDVTFTATGLAEFSTAARYLRAVVTAGTGESLTVLVVLRG